MLLSASDVSSILLIPERCISQIELSETSNCCKNDDMNKHLTVLIYLLYHFPCYLLLPTYLSFLIDLFICLIAVGLWVVKVLVDTLPAACGNPQVLWAPEPRILCGLRLMKVNEEVGCAIYICGFANTEGEKCTLRTRFSNPVVDSQPSTWYPCSWIEITEGHFYYFNIF